MQDVRSHSALLAQLILLEHPHADPTTIPAAQLDAALMTATATLAELQPTATEALLAAQMVGAQRAAMIYLQRALMLEQESEAVDRNVTRAVRLMRLFTEQVETMMKLKGKSSQQRVVVEHVTVAAVGKAIVEALIPGAGGRTTDMADEPHVPWRLWSLKNGNPPGDANTAPRCGAMTRRRTSCAQPAMRQRTRCRLHGGKSTGPRTADGLARSRRSTWKHGACSREVRARRAEHRRQWEALRALLE